MAVEQLVAGADVVVHLAFMIMGTLEDTERVNLEGSRTVFEVTAAAGVPRLVYASSVAAYGFHADNPPLLTEDVPARGDDRHYYSEQKARLEQILDEVIERSATSAYVFRPCIVAGRDALALITNIPYVQLFERLRGLGGTVSETVSRFLRSNPVLKPVLPDPGVRFQLVHHDDVARAMRAAVLGHGPPGPYNLAAPGELTMSDVADELGWYSLSVPRAAIDGLAELIERLPLAPAQAQWIESVRAPVLMDAAKARRELHWAPEHDARETVAEMVAAAREKGLTEFG